MALPCLLSDAHVRTRVASVCLSLCKCTRALTLRMYYSASLFLMTCLQLRRRYIALLQGESVLGTSAAATNRCNMALLVDTSARALTLHLVPTCTCVGRLATADDDNNVIATDYERWRELKRMVIVHGLPRDEGAVDTPDCASSLDGNDEVAAECSLRGRIWKIFLGVDAAIDAQTYNALAAQGASYCDDDIRNDTFRCVHALSAADCLLYGRTAVVVTVSSHGMCN